MCKTRNIDIVIAMTLLCLFYYHYHCTTVHFVSLLQSLTKSNNNDGNNNSNNITIVVRLFQMKPFEGFFWAKGEIPIKIFPMAPEADIPLVHFMSKELPRLLFANLPASL
jgi:hypothetical protein